MFGATPGSWLVRGYVDTVERSIRPRARVVTGREGPPHRGRKVCGSERISAPCFAIHSPASVRAVRRVFLPAGAPARRVRAGATGSVTSIMGAVRLIHRERLRENSLEEGECYEHSYGEHVSDHVEVVRLEPAGVRVEISVEVATEHHVTTQRLKGQFEERLAARGARRSRRARP